MRTVRRIYFYLVAFISLQVVLWGAIQLLYSFVKPETTLNGSRPLAQGLAQMVVGLPIFLLHWYFIQRDATNKAEERDSAIRAIFFYALRLGNLSVALLHLVSLLGYVLFTQIGLPLNRRFFFPDNDVWKNLIIIAINLIVLVIFENQLRKAWLVENEQQDLEYLIIFKRLFFFLWGSFNLVFFVIGFANIFHYIVSIPRGFNNLFTNDLANGLALLIPCLPVWVVVERYLSKSYELDEEKHSLIRKIFTYGSLFALVAVTLANLGVLLADIFYQIFRQNPEWINLPNQHGFSMGLLLIGACLWVYFSLQLSSIFKSAESKNAEVTLKRVLWYVLSFAGTILSLIGAWLLTREIIAYLYQFNTSGTDWARNFSRLLPLLIIGIPLWIFDWRKVHALGKQTQESENPEYQSLIRRIYLYLLVFITVITSMSTASIFMYQFIDSILVGSFELFGFKNVQNFLVFLVNLGWFLYHQRLLREDNQKSEARIQHHFAKFPVWILTGKEDSVAKKLTAQLAKAAPELPVKIIFFNTDAVPEGPVKVLIASAIDFWELKINNPLWYEHFSESVILLPITEEKIHWAGLENEKLDQLIQATVKKVLRMAQGELERTRQKLNPWAIVGYVILGILIVFFSFTAIVNLF